MASLRARHPVPARGCACTGCTTSVAGRQQARERAGRGREGAHPRQPGRGCFGGRSRNAARSGACNTCSGRSPERSLPNRSRDARGLAGGNSGRCSETRGGARRGTHSHPGRGVSLCPRCASARRHRDRRGMAPCSRVPKANALLAAGCRRDARACRAGARYDNPCTGARGRSSRSPGHVSGPPGDRHRRWAYRCGARVLCTSRRPLIPCPRVLRHPRECVRLPDEPGSRQETYATRSIDSSSAPLPVMPRASTPRPRSLRTRFATFRATPLSVEEEQRRAGQFQRFLALVPVEYGRGVEDGRVTLDFEVQEAITFRDGAAQAFGDLEPALSKIDRATAARIGELVDSARHRPLAGRTRSAGRRPRGGQG